MFIFAIKLDEERVKKDGFIIEEEDLLEDEGR